MAGRREDEEGGLSGGRFVEPVANALLPPIRRYNLQNLGAEPGVDMPYHIGERYSVGAIATITPGTDSYIQNIKFIYPATSGQVVTTVPAGEQFDFVVDYRCRNTAGNLLDLWSMCIVWWEVTDGPGLPTTNQFKLNGWYWKNVATSLAPTIIDDNGARLNNANPYLIMPARNIVLRFNMFANDDATPAQHYPDPSAWQQLI